MDKVEEEILCPVAMRAWERVRWDGGSPLPLTGMLICREEDCFNEIHVRENNRN